MKALFTLFLFCAAFPAFSQQDSVGVKHSSHRSNPSETIKLAKLNRSSNMMIGGGVGLCGVSAYLVYYGVSVYKAGPLPATTDPAGDIRRNHTQGIVFLTAATVAAGGAAALITIGAMRKYQFKLRRKGINVRGGLTVDGRILLALNF